MAISSMTLFYFVETLCIVSEKFENKKIEMNTNINLTITKHKHNNWKASNNYNENAHTKYNNNEHTNKTFY